MNSLVNMKRAKDQAVWAGSFSPPWCRKPGNSGIETGYCSSTKNLNFVALQAKVAARSTRWSLVARVALLWCMIRQTMHEKVEPLLTESEEILVQLAPQLAAFA